MGKLCFGILGFAFLLSAYDMYLIIRYAMTEITTKSRAFVEAASVKHFKNYFRSVTIVTTYVVGVSLHYFGM